MGFRYDGSNLMDILALNYIDTNKTITNNIEIYKLLGIEAARIAIMNELLDNEFDGTYINYRHITS